MNAVQLDRLRDQLTRLRLLKSRERLDASLTGSRGEGQQLTYPLLLILDELGYLPLSREEASLFFRLLVRRYERGSLIVTNAATDICRGHVRTVPEAHPPRTVSRRDEPHRAVGGTGRCY